MTELVTKAEAYAQLRIDDTAHDVWLAVWIPAVSQAVLNWLKDEWRAYDPELDADGNPVLDSAGDEIPLVDTSGNMTPRWSVKAAVLLELAVQFRYRDGLGPTVETGDLYSGRYGYTLSRGATAILQPLRKPTVR